LDIASNLFTVDEIMDDLDMQINNILIKNKKDDIITIEEGTSKHKV
jgi:hypothetical protein